MSVASKAVSFTLLTSFLVLSAPVYAATISDATDDFLSTFIGPHSGDLDVVSANVTYDGAVFTFTHTSAGPIGLTPGTLFVWGIDRGAGTSRFPTLAPGVLFDSVIVIDPLGAATVRDLQTGAATVLPIGKVTFSGDSLSAVVNASLLPSMGFAPANYTVNLWPRLGTGNNNQISDFAPDNSNAAVTATPEPSTILLLGSGLGIMMAAVRRRNKKQ